MRLLPATADHLPELMTWFPDAETLRIWGGWQFRFPFTPESFAVDAQLAGRPSYVLLKDEAMLAFGQVYLRAERIHFGRLAVAPPARGRGYGTSLLRALAAEGKELFGERELSLFVSRQNEEAARLYRRQGFAPAVYPEDGVPDDYAYMVAARII